ncbi:MAG: hypothetical protein Greene041619_1056 [Candidatus Peregrinibacteria bacterium Greene0416_19]|nr:MAG: hypothetical protein Greene041619_1056 [Candidatus Peregrinibacteria bacterium Greene0416_19]
MEHARTPQEMAEARSRFVEQYRNAFTAACSPSRADIEETFVAACGGEGAPSSRLHPLWVFFRCAIDQGTPLNWFLGDALGLVMPLQQPNLNSIERLRHLIFSSFRFHS